MLSAFSATHRPLTVHSREHRASGGTIRIKLSLGIDLNLAASCLLHAAQTVGYGSKAFSGAALSCTVSSLLCEPVCIAYASPHRGGFQSRTATLDHSCREHCMAVYTGVKAL